MSIDHPRRNTLPSSSLKWPLTEKQFSTPARGVNNAATTTIAAPPTVNTSEQQPPQHRPTTEVVTPATAQSAAGLVASNGNLTTNASDFQSPRTRSIVHGADSVFNYGSSSLVSHGEPASISSVVRTIGRNRLFCGGRCLTGPDISMALVAFLLLLVPCVLFDSVELPWYYRNGPKGSAGLLTFLSIVLQLSSIIFFFGTACADPGIIPREPNPLSAYDPMLKVHREKAPPKHQDAVICGYLFKLKYCST